MCDSEKSEILFREIMWCTSWSKNFWPFWEFKNSCLNSIVVDKVNQSFHNFRFHIINFDFSIFGFQLFPFYNLSIQQASSMHEHCAKTSDWQLRTNLWQLNIVPKSKVHTVSFQIFRSPFIHVSFLVKNCNQEFFREIA